MYLVVAGFTAASLPSAGEAGEPADGADGLAFAAGESVSGRAPICWFPAEPMTFDSAMQSGSASVKGGPELLFTDLMTAVQGYRRSECVDNLKEA